MSSAADHHAKGPGPQGNPGADRPGLGEDPSLEEIEADIARTRHELGETVEALSDRLDPKAQADRQVEHLKERAREQVDHARGSAQSRLNHARGSAQSRLSHARHVVADPDNPAPALIAALVGAAAFASLGLLITRRR